MAVVFAATVALLAGMAACKAAGISVFTALEEFIVVVALADTVAFTVLEA